MQVPGAPHHPARGRLARLSPPGTRCSRPEPKEPSDARSRTPLPLLDYPGRRRLLLRLRLVRLRVRLRRGPVLRRVRRVHLRLLRRLSTRPMPAATAARDGPVSRP